METRYSKTIRAKRDTGMHSKESEEIKSLQTYKSFLLDLIPLIKENLNEVKKENKDDYNNGRAFSYIEVLSLIQLQAKAFGIDLTELGLENDMVTELFY